MRVVLFLAACVMVSGCEAKEAKYERLNSELLRAQLAVGNDGRASETQGPACPDLTHLPTNEYLNACTQRIEANRARLALAQREMNKFMGGAPRPVSEYTAPAPTSPPAPIARPCSGKRPYKNWSNAEVSTALVRHMGTDNPALVDLIEEAGCRQP